MKTFRWDLLLVLLIALFGLSCEKEKESIEMELLTDARDGAVYNVTQIGNQKWMTENLRYDATASCLNLAHPSVKYGRTYSWATLMNGGAPSNSTPSGVQGLCPDGWHLPSDTEWNTLEIAMGLDEAEAQNSGYRGTHATRLKSTVYWDNAGNGTNSSGLNIFPAAISIQCIFSTNGLLTNYWTSSEGGNSSLAWSRGLRADKESVYRTDLHDKDQQYYCRCIED